MNKFRGEFKVKIGGAELPAAFTNSVLYMLEEHEGIKIEKLAETIEANQLSTFAKICFYSCKVEAIRKGKEFKIPKERFIVELLDENDIEEIGEAIGKALSLTEKKD